MITINPNENVQAVVGNPVCFEASAIQIIPQEDERCIDLPSSGTNWTFDSVACTWTRTGGTNGSAAAPALSTDLVYGLQPFYIDAGNFSFDTPASPNRIFASFVGAFNDVGTFYGWYIWKNCGSQSVGACSAANGDNSNANWKGFVYIGGVIVATFNVNFHERFRLRSDGVNLHWDIFTSGSIGGHPAPPTAQWVTSLYSVALPSTTTWQFHLNSLYNNNVLHYIRTFKGTYQGNVPMTWSTPLGGTLVGDGNTRCFSSGIAGSYQVCVDSDFDEEICVDIDVDDLYLLPVEWDGDNYCAYTGEIVHLRSNGGYDGVLTASTGTVIDPLTWEAPGSPHVLAALTYTLGAASVDLPLKILDRLKVTNVLGDTITGLAPGDSFQLEVNEPWIVSWTNIDCPNLVTPGGLITIPKRANDDCFGALDCHIRGTASGLTGGIFICDNLIDPETEESNVYVDLRIIVDPTFPTPQFGGARPTKWKPETPDFRVIINEMEGGCDETYIRNRVPIMRWTVNYSGLQYEDNSPCAPIPCCDEPMGYVDGYYPTFQTAKRLDDFWMLVAGQWGYFTLIDYRTGKLWRHVRFESKMERDHINWKRTHSRTFTMVWHPCCAQEPLGGACPHSSTIIDGYAPVTPGTPTVTVIDYTHLRIHWPETFDNVGVMGYELEVDGNAIDLSNVLYYEHTELAANSTHNYRVRAYDFSRNYSAWSGTGSGTTSNPDLQNPTVPADLSVLESPGLQEIHLVWTESSDNIAVAGYKLLADGVVIDVGDVLEYTDTGLACGSTHEYYIRAYDAAGNLSPWSEPYVIDTLPDTTVPTVSITSPAERELVSGTITVTADVDDNVEVLNTLFYYYNNFTWNFFGNILGNTGPYQMDLDTDLITGNSIIIAVVAFDLCLNQTTTLVAAYKDVEPPEISFINPLEGDIIDGTVTLKALATDDIGIANVQYYYSDQVTGEATYIGFSYDQPYAVHFVTDKLASKPIYLMAIAFDHLNNPSNVATIRVTINN